MWGAITIGSGPRTLYLPYSVVNRHCEKAQCYRRLTASYRTRLWLHLSRVGILRASVVALGCIGLVFLFNSCTYQRQTPAFHQRGEHPPREVGSGHIHAFPARKIVEQPLDYAVAAPVPKLGVPLQLGRSVGRVVHPVHQGLITLSASHPPGTVSPRAAVRRMRTTAAFGATGRCVEGESHNAQAGPARRSIRVARVVSPVPHLRSPGPRQRPWIARRPIQRASFKLRRLARLFPQQPRGGNAMPKETEFQRIRRSAGR